MTKKGIEIIMKKTNDFGTRLEALYHNRGISINKLARRTHVYSTTVHEWVGKPGRFHKKSRPFKETIRFFLFES